MTAILECDCGDCRSCRRAMGLESAPAPKVVLSESTRRILADLDKPKTAAPTPKPAPKPPRPRKTSATQRQRATESHCKHGHPLTGSNIVIRKHGSRTRRECVTCRNDKAHQPWQAAVESKASKPKPPTKWCELCGGEIGLTFCAWKGWRYTGRADKCEVCCNLDKYAAELEELLLKPETKTVADWSKIQRLRGMLSRELRDGRAYAPDTDRHGTSYAYQSLGCRCADCVGWKVQDNEARRARKGSAK